MPTPPDTAAPAPTFADAWHTWLAYRCCGARPLRLSTIADYESAWRCHLEPNLGPTPLAEIDGAAIARLVVALSAKGVRPARLYKIVAPVRACLRWHYRIGGFEKDPTRWFDAPVPPSAERKILTIEQLEHLIAAMPPFYRPLVTFSAYTGVRLGELRAITWADVDFERRCVRIDKTFYRDQLQRSTKSGHDRVVPIPSHVLEALREWRSRCPGPSPAGLLFPEPSGAVLDADRFRQTVWRRAVRDAGLPADLRIHDLRHTSASLYLRHGATVREVMEIHGWRQMQTALRYLHTTESLNAAADRLSEARDEAIRE